jgi:hypothetical protein
MNSGVADILIWFAAGNIKYTVTLSHVDREDQWRGTTGWPILID